ncbi:MAG TPA: dihydroneopterin aldolase [Bacteroidaceae bacterium]|nr:dihydroneopterin aldolase [Bacteroidaceae bacterium]
MKYGSQILKLNNMRFYAYHGVERQEKLNGAYFRVNLEMLANLDKAIESDNIQDTINYADAFNIVKNEMEKPCNLIENVAGKIVKKLFLQLASLESVNISIEKEHPPLPGECSGAAIVINVTAAQLKTI